jgi:hypothetical protein
MAQSLSAVEERVAGAERELRIQFARLAQLQTEFDLLVASRRCPPDAATCDDER